jgi:hypothetical protein
MGTVYFWDHEKEADLELPSYDNVFVIADSFDKFLSSLTTSSMAQ